MDPDNPQSTAYAFLRWRWPDPVEDGWLTLCYRDAPGAQVKVKGAYPIDNTGLKKLAGDSIALAGDADTWVLLNGLGAEPPPGRKGSEVGVRYLVGLHEDLDKGIENPVEFLLGLGEWRPSVIVDSGNGVHAYWLYSIDVDLKELAENSVEKLHQVRGEYRALGSRFHRWLVEQAGGVEFDDCSNLDRIMRLPGTWNRKRNEHKLVQVIQADDGRRFHPQALMNLVKDVQIRERHLGAAEEFGRQGSASEEEAAAVVERLTPVYVHRANSNADGGRNHSLFKFAQQLNDHYVGRDLAMEAVLAARAQVTEYTPSGEYDPLTTEELSTTVASAYKLPPRGPATAPVEDWQAGVIARLNGGGGVIDVAEVGEALQRLAGPASLGELPAVVTPGGGPPAGIVTNVTPDDERSQKVLPDGYPVTDVGNALRFIALAKGRVRFVEKWQSWIVYADGAWRLDASDARVKELAKRVTVHLEAMALDADRVIDNAERQLMLKFAMKAGNSGPIGAMVHLARGIPGVLIEHEELDAQPHLLNCLNGTVDLRTGELLPHNPADLLMTQASSYYRGMDWQGGLWQQVLEEWQPDAEVREFLQRAVGSAATGTPVEALIVNIGEGANGKSKFFGAVAHALGPYSVIPHKSLVIAGKHEPHPTHVASLFGARMLSVPETGQGARLDEEQVKQLTGGDRLTARRMREDEWSFEPSWTAFMHTNHPPRISGGDDAIWRRVRLVPWDVVIPEERRDLMLKAKLAVEEVQSQVLGWMVAGAVDWYRVGLMEPDKVRLATREYRAEEDSIGRFIEEVGLEFGEDTPYEAWWIQAGELATLHQMWHGSAGVIGNENRHYQLVVKRLKEQHGVVSGKSLTRGGRYLAGVRVINTPDQEDVD